MRFSATVSPVQNPETNGHCDAEQLATPELVPCDLSRRSNRLTSFLYKSIRYTPFGTHKDTSTFSSQTQLYVKTSKYRLNCRQTHSVSISVRLKGIFAFSTETITQVMSCQIHEQCRARYRGRVVESSNSSPIGNLKTGINSSRDEDDDCIVSQALRSPDHHVTSTPRQSHCRHHIVAVHFLLPKP